MTIEEFKKLSDVDMCNMMNQYMENHTKRNFKSQKMNFSFSQAEKAMEEQGIYKLGGVYRTGAEAIDLINAKEKERSKRDLTADDLDKLSVLLEPERYTRLVRLSDSYNYVSDFILNENRGIQIKSGNPDEIITTSVRMYDSTKEKWKAFGKAHPGFTATDMLNTALIEFMNRHAAD